LAFGGVGGQQERNHDQPDTVVPSTIDLNGNQHVLGHIDCSTLEAHGILLLIRPQHTAIRLHNRWQSGGHHNILAGRSYQP
jgi:hypothetical protein